MEFGFFKEGMILFGLGIQSIWDIRTKHISLWFAIAWGICGIGFHIYMQTEFWSCVYACIPGVVCFFLAFITREAIGLGDAWILLALGCWESIAGILMVSMTALMLCGVLALLLLIGFKKSRKTELPFVPFLFMSYGVFCILGG